QPSCRCSNPAGQIISGAGQAWLDINAELSGGLVEMVGGGAKTVWDNAGAVLRGDKSFGDAVVNIYDYEAKVSTNIALGIVTLPWEAMKEQIAWQGALLDGNLKEATYHGIRDAWDTFNVATFFVGGAEAGALRGARATRAARAGEAGDALSMTER